MKIFLKDWEKYWNRPLSVNQAQFYSWSSGKSLAAILGRGIKNHLVLIKEDNADGYAIKEEKDSFDKYVVKKCLQNTHFLKTSLKQALAGSREIEKFFLSLRKIDFYLLENNDLSKFLKKSKKVLYTRIAHIWVGFWLDDAVSQQLKIILDKHGLLNKESINILSSPLKPTHIIQEQIDLNKIVLSKSDQAEQLKKHSDKYSYIPCYGPEVNPYDFQYFKKRFQKVSRREARQFIAYCRRNFIINSKNFTKFLRDHDFTAKEKLFFRYYQEFIFFKDYRSHFRSIAMFHYGRLLSAISRRYNLKLTDVSLLLFEEIKELLSAKNSSGKLKKTLKNRRSGCVYFLKNNQEGIIGLKDLIIKGEVNKEEILRGMPAGSGIASGPVKIVLNPNSLNKVKPGDVLVSSMTRPDYLSAMAKSAAIITDEGGITCHAAIVSREIGKPCVVGTKRATELFKDGDLVKVDGNRGIIKRIK